jgi:hypothetical protein
MGFEMPSMTDVHDEAIGHQERWNACWKLRMISGTGFWLFSVAPSQLDGAARKPLVFLAFMTDQSRKPAALHHGRQEAGCDRQR